MTTQPPDSRKVFVVHGRNAQIKEAMFDFLQAIGLEPIEWTKAVAMTRKGTPYVGEVLDVALRSGQAIVVVMTPDDEAKLRDSYQKDDDPPYERVLTPQPRPNVLFEAGFAMGHAPDRTVLVQIGNNIRPFSDIQGRHVVRLNNTRETREDLAQRLQTVGCPVVLKGDEWRNKGNFEIHEKPSSTPESSGKDDSAGSAPDAQRELEQTEIDILTVMAREGEKRCAVSDIAQKLGIHVQRVQYYLDGLCESKHVRRISRPYFGEILTHYEIDENGRAYLVEHNII